MPVAGVTSTLTSFIGSHGVYAVFALMALDAVFPAASELVMVYAGALAAAAFAGQHVDLFGARVDSHAWAYVVMALAGTLGYLVGSIVGWALGRSYERFHHDFRFVDYAILAAVVGLIAYLLARRRSRLAGGRAED